MMTEKQRIEWLLELQEHPEQLTDEQLQQILADDEMRQLATRLKTTPQMWRANGRSLQPAIQKN